MTYSIQVETNRDNPFAAKKDKPGIRKKAVINGPLVSTDHCDDEVQEIQARHYSDGLIMAHSLNVLRSLTEKLDVKGDDAISLINSMLKNAKELADKLTMAECDRKSAMITATHILAAYQDAGKRLSGSEIKVIADSFRGFATGIGELNKNHFIKADKDTSVSMAIMDVFASLSPLELEKVALNEAVEEVFNIAMENTRHLNASDDAEGILIANMIRNTGKIYAANLLRGADAGRETRVSTGLMVGAANSYASALDSMEMNK